MNESSSYVCLKKQQKLGHKEAQILKPHNVKHEDKCMQINKQRKQCLHTVKPACESQMHTLK